jgi:hypothetical protein
MTAARYGSGLISQHAAKLRSSAVAPDVATERGYRTVDSRADLKRHGFGYGQAQLHPALLIPLRTVWNQPGGYQIRPDSPRVNRGKVAKYETRQGERMVIDCHPRVRPVLADPSIPLIVTEGPIKAGAIVSAGGHALALLGVWNFRGKNDLGAVTDLPDLGQVAWKARRVLICFDSDVTVKSPVQMACARLKALLERQGAEVLVVYLPAPALTKVGVDDWLADGHKLAELWRYASPDLRCPEPEPTEPADTFEDIPDEGGADLLDAVADFLRRHVVFTSDAQAAAATLWAAHTHALDAFESSPRLAVASPQKQSGKTRLLELLRLVCHDARLSANMSPAYLFRIVGTVRPTLLIDEVDAIFRTGDRTHEDLRALINAGHRRDATVGRVEGDGAAMVAKEFPVYTPLATAGIGLPPETVLDRAVLIRLRRRARGESVTAFRQRVTAPEGLVLRRRLAAWAHRHMDKLAVADPAMPEGIEDRPADVWEPLLAIADLAGDGWPEWARLAAQAINGDRAGVDPNVDLALLEDLRVIMTGKNAPTRDRWFTADLCEALNRRPEGTWKNLRSGYGIDAGTLAATLRPYDIGPRRIRVADTTARGYMIDDFRDAWTRYLAPSAAGEGDE